VCTLDNTYSASVAGWHRALDRL